MQSIHKPFRHHTPTNQPARKTPNDQLVDYPMPPKAIRKENNASHNAGDEMSKTGEREFGMSRINENQSIDDSEVDIPGDISSK